MTIKVVDIYELAVAMCEASYQIDRPPGTTGKQALDSMEPECREGWLRAAAVAVDMLVAKAHGSA